MQEFPPAETLSPIIGATLRGFVYQDFALELFFSNEVTIVVEESFYAKLHGEILSIVPRIEDADGKLCHFVGLNVGRINRDDYLLTLFFKGGELEIKSVPGQFESGHIWIGASMFVF